MKTKPTGLSLTSYGAAGEVTGSQHLIQTQEGVQVLLDCGLFQGHRQEAALKNCEFLYTPAQIAAVLLSHAHIDHSGLIPKLVKDGFPGQIYTTEGTKELSHAMLLDSAHIQEEDERYYKKHHLESPLSVKLPLYTQRDAEKAFPHFIGKPYEQAFQISDGITAEFFDAGHVFGSAITVVTIKTPDGKKKIVYTGDLGRENVPIIKDPMLIGEADYLIIESTYGNREHERVTEVEEDLEKIILRTVKRGGKIFVPAFALERTQEMILRFEHLIYHKKIPELMIYVDSPLASKLTKVFEHFPEYYDEEMKAKLKNKRNIFSFPNLKFTESVEESKELNFINVPAIIIAGSGMMENGRIRHHLKNNIEDSRNTFMVVGYQAANTLGRKIVEGRKVISLFNQDYHVRSEIVSLKSLSAHADQSGLDSYVHHIKGLKKIFLVHGEEDSRHGFAKRISTFYKGVEIILPERGVSYEL